MVYIDFINNDEELLKQNEIKYNSFLKKGLIFFRKKTSYISVSNTEFGEIVQIQNFNNKTYKNLEKILKMYRIKKVCLSNKFKDNEKFEEFLKSNQVMKVTKEILNKYLIQEVIEFVCNSKEEKIQYQEISFLINKNNIITNLIINNIAKIVKNVNVITTNQNQFRTLENRLYNNDGIVLNLTNNYKKSLMNSNVIINFDFSQEQINRYDIPKYACIIDFSKNNININKKSFEGLNIGNFKYSVNKNIDNNKFKSFDKEDFYSSLLVKNSNQENILNRVKKDNVRIIELYGKNGVIRKKEFDKLKRNLI